MGRASCWQDPLPVYTQEEQPEAFRDSFFIFLFLTLWSIIDGGGVGGGGGNLTLQPVNIISIGSS